MFGTELEPDGLPYPDVGKICVDFLFYRKPIILKWKDPTSSTHSHWISELTFRMKLEKIRYQPENLRIFSNLSECLLMM